MLRPEVTYDANNRVVTPGYFESIRIPLRRGRLFNDADGMDAPPVAIINDSIAVSRLLASLLFGSRAVDPLAYLGAITVFCAVLACYFPARRAAPMDANRSPALPIGPAAMVRPYAARIPAVHCFSRIAPSISG